MAILLNLVYGCVLLTLSPLILWRAWRLGKYRDGWSEKLWGQLPENLENRSLVWFHAVSVGEVLLLRKMIASYRSHHPHLSLLITTTTVTGRAVAEKTFGDQATVAYAPLDFSWAVRTSLDRVQPDLIVLVELELWPNLINEAHRRQIPITVINGRLSQKSFRGYRKVRPLMRTLLRKLSWIGAQSRDYAERFVALGAPEEIVSVTGSIKFDQLATDRNQESTRELRQVFGIAEDEPVVVFGSTQAPEERFALECFQVLVGKFPKLNLIIVPRHQERFEEVATLIQDHGWQVMRRSQIPAARQPISHRPAGDRPIRLLDTLGELSACWGLADVAYVGGSMSNRGGQNMMEPSAYGAAVLFGPNTQNFRDAVDLLTRNQASIQVQNREDLEHQLERLLADPDLRTELGERAARLVLDQQGALNLTIGKLNAIIDDRPECQLPSAA